MNILETIFADQLNEMVDEKLAAEEVVEKSLDYNAMLEAVVEEKAAAPSPEMDDGVRIETMTETTKFTIWVDEEGCKEIWKHVKNALTNRPEVPKDLEIQVMVEDEDGYDYEYDLIKALGHDKNGYFGIAVPIGERDDILTVGDFYELGEMEYRIMHSAEAVDIAINNPRYPIKWIDHIMNTPDITVEANQLPHYIGVRGLDVVTNITTDYLVVNNDEGDHSEVFLMEASKVKNLDCLPAFTKFTNDTMHVTVIGSDKYPEGTLDCEYCSGDIYVELHNNDVESDSVELVQDLTDFIDDVSETNEEVMSGPTYICMNLPTVNWTTNFYVRDVDIDSNVVYVDSIHYKDLDPTEYVSLNHFLEFIDAISSLGMYPLVQFIYKPVKYDKLHHVKVGLNETDPKYIMYKVATELLQKKESEELVLTGINDGDKYVVIGTDNNRESSEYTNAIKLFCVPEDQLDKFTPIKTPQLLDILYRNSEVKFVITSAS